MENRLAIEEWRFAADGCEDGDGVQCGRAEAAVGMAQRSAMQMEGG
jgi:hypothetical protein